MPIKRASLYLLTGWLGWCLLATLPISADAGQKYDFNENKLDKEVWSNPQGGAEIKAGVLLIPTR